MKLLIRLIINAIALYAAAQLVNGIELTDQIGGILIVALIFGIVNAILGPILKILSFPFLLVTLGLFTLVINGLLLWLTAALLDSLSVSGFWAAFWGALVISIVSWLLSAFLKDDIKALNQPKLNPNLYDTENNMAMGRISPIAAIIVGWVIIEVVAFLLGILGGVVESSGLIDSLTLGKILLFGVGVVAATIGGYVAGNLSGQRKFSQGFWAGFISAIFSIGLAYFQTSGDVAQLIAPEPIISWVLLPIFSTIGAMFSR